MQVPAMLRLLLASAILALAPALAHAQVTGALPNSSLDSYSGNPFNVMPSYERPMTAEDMRRDNEIERHYRDTLRTRIPDRKAASNDPWKGVRPSPAAAPAYDRHRPY